MTPRPPRFHDAPDAPIAAEAVDLGNIPAPVLRTERDDLLRAIETHMAEMDMRTLKPGRDRDDIDNDLYNVATRIREANGGAPDPTSTQLSVSPDPDPNFGKPTGTRCDSCDREERVGDEGWEGREGLDWCPDCFVEDEARDTGEEPGREGGEDRG